MKGIYFFSGTRMKAVQGLMEEHHMLARRSYGIRGKTLGHLNQDDSAERLQAPVHPKESLCSDLECVKTQKRH